MKSLKIVAGLAIGLCVVEVAQAAPMVPAGQWQCYATNNRGMRWFQNAADRHYAMKRARQRCFSAGSAYCHVNAGQCRYNQGRLWICSVRDHLGRVFNSTGTTANYACVNAKNQCRRWHNNHRITNYKCAVVSERRA